MYFSAVGGFSEDAGVVDDVAFYQGPANALLGDAVAFVASVMFVGHQRLGAGALFGNRQAGPPESGWEIRVDATLATVEVATSGGVVAVSTALPAARPYHIVSLVFVGTSVLAVVVDGVGLLELAVVDPYVPAVGAAGIGARAPASLATRFAAEGSYIIGAAYTTGDFSGESYEQVFRHQLVCLEAGDMVDGAAGGAFSNVMQFTNLYSARRGNNGVGQRTFIAGQSANIAIGQVPLAAAVWPDENSTADFTRVDSIDPQLPSCFTTGFKRVG